MDEEQDLYQVTLTCWDCDHSDCRLNQIIHEDDKDGCVRSVDEELYIEYYHQLKEVWPFALKQSKEIVDREYKKTIQVLDKVYSSPIAKRNGRGFKVVRKVKDAVL